MTWWKVLLTSLDDVEVLGVNVTVLGEVEVLLCDEYALCGDRVSAYPYMQLKATKLCIFCHSHGMSGVYTNRGRGTYSNTVSNSSFWILEYAKDRQWEAHGQGGQSREFPNSNAPLRAMLR